MYFYVYMIFFYFVIISIRSYHVSKFILIFSIIWSCYQTYRKLWLYFFLSALKFFKTRLDYKCLWDVVKKDLWKLWSLRKVFNKSRLNGCKSLIQIIPDYCINCCTKWNDANIDDLEGYFDEPDFNWDE